MIELLAEMQGELNRTPQINITLTAEWLHIRTTIVQALVDLWITPKHSVPWWPP